MAAVVATTARPRGHRSRSQNQNNPVDPHELTRRLNEVLAEERRRDLSHKRHNWENDLRQARQDQRDRARDRMLAECGKRFSLSVGPTDSTPSSHLTLAEDRTPGSAASKPLRRASQPFVTLPHYVPQYAAEGFLNSTSPGKASADAGASSRTISTPGLDSGSTRGSSVGDSKENRPPEWNAGKLRNRASMLMPVNENCLGDRVDAADAPRTKFLRRCSSALRAPSEHLAQDWSQSDEAQIKARRKSLLERFESFYLVQPKYPDSAIERYTQSEELTLGGSLQGSTKDVAGARRRSSLLRRVESLWTLRPSPLNEIQVAERDQDKDGQTESEASTVVATPIVRRKASFFSKLRF